MAMLLIRMHLRARLVAPDTGKQNWAF